MGAAAFLMAELAAIPYADIVIYELLPAVLFHVCIVFTATIISLDDGIEPPRITISWSVLC